MQLFTAFSSRLAKALVPQVAVDLIRVGRLTALSKPDGGVRGIVAGDVIRRLVARTMSQQLSEAVERATAPYQCALTTRAGCECIAHILLHPELTITSIDGIGAFDAISRESLMRGLLDVEGGGAALPFICSMVHHRNICGRTTKGQSTGFRRVRGGEQGDAMMPLLFAVGQHRALEATHRRDEPRRVLDGVP